MDTTKRIKAYTERIRVRQIAATLYRDNLLFLASGISFDALLAAIPLALLVLAVMGAEDLRSVLQAIMPVHPSGAGEPFSQAERIINQVVASRRELSLYGVPLFLLFSTRLFASARVVLDQILAVKTKRRFLHDLAHDLVMVVATTAAFAANSYVSLPALGYSGLDRLAAVAAAVVFGTVLFFIVYFLAPTKKLQWRTALMVALIVSVVFEVFKFLFGGYLVQFATVNRVISHANAIAVLLFVFWIYLTALIFLFGGEVAKAVEEHRRATGDRRKMPPLGPPPGVADRRSDGPDRRQKS